MLYYGQNSVPYDGNAQSSYLLEPDCPGGTQKWSLYLYGNLALFSFVQGCPPVQPPNQAGWQIPLWCVFITQRSSVVWQIPLCCVFITFTAPGRTHQLHVDLFLWLSRFSGMANKPQGFQLMVPCLGLLKAIWLVSRIFWVHKVLRLCKISLQHNKTLTGKTHQAVRNLRGVRQFSDSINLAIKMWRSPSRHTFNRYKDVQPFHSG